MSDADGESLVGRVMEGPVIYVREGERWAAMFDYGEYGGGFCRISFKGVGKTIDDARESLLVHVNTAKRWIDKIEDAS